MNIGDLLGGLIQTGMSPSTGDRMKTSMGGRGILEGLAGMLGGGSEESAQGPLAGAAGGGALGGILSGAGGGGALGGVLDKILGGASKAVGGNRNLALGGLGALAGALLGGKKGLGGALGGGVMAILGAMAFKALKGIGSQKQPQVPLGLLEPRTDAEKAELDRRTELVLRAMINAAKADGQIDQSEVRRILGKLQEIGIDKEAEQYLMNEFRKPAETQQLIAAARGKMDLAAQMYAASLMAIEVDTPAEKQYLAQLASGMGLQPEAVQRVHEMVGLQPA